MWTELLAQTMDVNIKRSIFGIELALEDFGDQLFASDDRPRSFGQAREDFVFDCCQRQHGSVDRHPPRSGFEDHSSNRLHGHSLPRPAGQAATGRVSYSGRLGDTIIANLFSFTLLTFGKSALTSCPVFRSV
jgi:hypothetical protein